LKILLLEDELMLQNSILEYLETLGHKCLSFGDGLKAKESIDTTYYDLLILDINVPYLDGLSLLENLNCQNKFIPVIYISALIDIYSITNAFTLGAMDYIKKPFHLKELGLRVQKISKDIVANKRQHIILSENYCYSREKNTLLFNSAEQNLTNKQRCIIHFLCENIGSIISYDTFRNYVWEYNDVSDATIRTEISRLRKVLKEDFIQNHKGVGYKIDKHIKNS
jgi:DNA-binding response OmpR family regulator